MASLNLSGAAVAAQVNPTTGTVGRERIGPSAIGQALVQGAGLAADLYGEQSKRNAQADEAAGVLRTLDSLLEDEEAMGVDFQNDPTTAGANAAAAAASEGLGQPLNASQRESLDAAAQVGTRISNALQLDPSKERQFNITRTRELRNLIAKHPEMAREFRSLIYGSNNFITDLVESDNAAAAAAAKARAEAAGRIRDKLIDVGDLTVATMSDDELLVYAPSTRYYQNYQRFQQAQLKADTLRAESEANKIVDTELVRQTAIEMGPGARQAMMDTLGAIVSNPELDEATKMRAIDEAVLVRRGWLAEQFPQLGADEVHSMFGDVLDTIPDTYRRLAGSGPERDAAENQLTLERAASELDLRTRFPQLDVGKFVVDMYATAAQALGPNWQRQNREEVQKAIMPWMEVAAALQSGASDPQMTPTQRADRQLAEEVSQEVRFTARMLQGYDTMDETMRQVAVKQVIRGLEHPDNLRSDAGLDKWIGLLASPQFADVAKSSEFSDAFASSTAHRRIEQYLGNLDAAAGRTLAGLDSQVTVELEGEGLLAFKPTGTLTAAEKDRVVRLNNRLQNVLRAQMNLYGLSAREASQNFYDEYLSQ